MGLPIGEEVLQGRQVILKVLPTSAGAWASLRVVAPARLGFWGCSPEVVRLLLLVNAFRGAAGGDSFLVFLLPVLFLLGEGCDGASGIQQSAIRSASCWYPE